MIHFLLEFSSRKAPDVGRQRWAAQCEPSIDAVLSNGCKNSAGDDCVDAFIQGGRGIQGPHGAVGKKGENVSIPK